MDLQEYIIKESSLVKNPNVVRISKNSVKENIDGRKVKLKNKKTEDTLVAKEIRSIDDKHEKQKEVYFHEEFIKKYNIKKGERIDLELLEEVEEAKSITLKCNKETEIDKNSIKKKLIGEPISKEQNIKTKNNQKIEIIESKPKNKILMITQETEFQFIQENKNIGNITYEDIGGLNQELEKIKQMVELPLKNSEKFEELGVSPPRGVLLHGPPGTGKTLLAKAVANETDSDFYHISGPEIISKFYGESEEQLREIFEKAEQNSPSIIFIDEIDSIAPGREESTGEVEKRIVSQLLPLMDGLEERGKVVVIGATNRLDSIDNALRRGGRFDREIEIGVPNKKERKEILQIHLRGTKVSDSLDKQKILDKTLGFVGSDISKLVREASVDSIVNNINSSSDELKLNSENFEKALNNVEPSAMREFRLNNDKRYDDIGGMEEEIGKIRKSVELPINKPEYFEEIGAESPKGTLLYGPPGTGKTLLAKAVANESDSNFISVKGPELLNKYVGESEKGVRDIFKKARQNSPCIIFFDEIDAIAKTRENDNGENVTERVVSQLLTELDGIESLEDVKVIATTNRPDLIDQALLRPGRFDSLIEVSLPDKEERKEIFKVHIDDKADEDLSYDKLAEKTEGYTGSDIEEVCEDTKLRLIEDAIEDGLDPEDIQISEDDIESSINDNEPHLDNSNLKSNYEVSEDELDNAFI